MFSKAPIPPILGFIGHHRVGKTTLLTQLLPLLCERGICVGMIKHVHDQFDVDIPGKDSYELRKAGAQQMLVTSSQRWALMVERDFAHEPKIDEHIAHLDYQNLDLILVEGFNQGSFPKIELHRPALRKPLLFPDDPKIIAIASDSPLILPDHLALLDINKIEDICRYIETAVLNQSPTSSQHATT